MANPLHSKASPDWWTPLPIVEAARTVLGGIDLDPMSCAEVQERIRATAYFTKEDDCFTRPWHGAVLLNPAGGTTRRAWRYLLAEFAAGRVTAAVWVGYSLEQLQTLQTDGPGPLRAAHAICVCRSRIKFDCSPEDHARMQAALDAKNLSKGRPLTPWVNAPTHGSYIAYLGGRLFGRSFFAQEFRTFGEVLTP